MTITDLPSQLLLMDGIFPDQSQPRRSFSLEQHEALKASMAAQGLLQPLLVRKDAARKQYLIVCGERRWRCAQELGWDKVPCRVIDWDISPAEILTLELTENLLREDLNPLDEARSLARLQELLTCSREELATQTRRSPASICRSFKLLDLPPEIQSQVEVGQLAVSIAAELHRLSDPALQREIADKVATGGMTRDDVSRTVQQAASSNKATKAKSLTMALAPGLSLRVLVTMPLKECDRAVSAWLRQLRDAKRNAVDLAAFAASLTTEPSVSND